MKARRRGNVKNKRGKKMVRKGKVRLEAGSTVVMETISIAVIYLPLIALYKLCYKQSKDEILYQLSSRGYILIIRKF